MNSLEVTCTVQSFALAYYSNYNKVGNYGSTIISSLIISALLIIAQFIVSSAFSGFKMSLPHDFACSKFPTPLKLRILDFWRENSKSVFIENSVLLDLDDFW